MLGLLLVVFGFFCEANGYLNRVYTKDDELKLVGLIVDSQSENHKSKWFFENSLSSTFYATDGLSLLKRDIPNSSNLCQTLQSYKPSNWEEFHHLLMTRSKMKGCLKSITDKTRSKLTNGLESSKLSQVYYAIDAVSALTELGLFDSTSLDFERLLSHIATFQTQKDYLFAETSKSSSSSVYRSSLALISTVKLLSMCEPEYLILHGEKIGSTLEKFVLAAKSLFGKYDSNGEFLSYANSLTATSFVVESLESFISQLKQLKNLNENEQSHYDNLLNDFVDPFNDGQYVEKLTRYILSYTGNTNVVTSRHIICLMRIIGNSIEFSRSVPISIIFWNNVFNSDGKNVEGAGFRVHVSNVFDDAILTNSDISNAVTLSSSKEFYSKKEGPKGSFSLVSGSNNKDFEYDFGTNLVKYIGTSDGSDSASFGMFNLVIDIYDNKLFGELNEKGALTVRADVKVLTKITGVVFGAALAKNIDSSGYERVKYPNGRIKEILEISPSQKAKFEISIKCEQRPTFIAVQFVDSQDNVVTQVVPRRRQEKYSLSIDISKKTYNVLKEGRYSVNLVLSDALYENGGIVWKNVVSFDAFEEEEEMVEKDYEPINDETPLWKAKHEIEHTFGHSEEKISSFITLIFSLIVWLPFAWLIFVYLFQEKVYFSCGDVALPLAFLFILSLSSVAGILAIYWLQTNIFQATGYLVCVSVPLYFIMYRILKSKLIQRTGKKTKSD